MSIFSFSDSSTVKIIILQTAFEEPGRTKEKQSTKKGKIAWKPAESISERY